MTKAHEATVRALMDRHGRTFSNEVGIRLADTPSPLFCWLVASILFSARIGAGNAVEAARAMVKAGYTTAEKMTGATWQQRVDVLTAHGYKRYDESASRMLGDTAQMLLERYKGDLRRLREEAERDPERERRLLKECKGLGDVGVDIFFREAQEFWDELFPFADKVAAHSAEKLGLPKTAQGLVGLVPRKDYVRLLSALVRTQLANDHDEIRRSALNGDEG